MKYTVALIIIILLPITFTACRMDHPDPISPQGPTHSILLSIAPEFESIEEESEPLSVVKNSVGDIYAVQIYKRGINSYSKYAYGIFDDHSLMSIELKLGEYYKIEMTMVPNGATVIAQDENGGYQAPFIVFGALGNAPGEVTNEFVIDRFEYMTNISSGYAVVTKQNASAEAYDMPPISRFFGVYEFESIEGMTCTINLKWVVFGLTVMPLNFTDGSIHIEMKGAPKLIIDADKPEDAITKKIFTFSHNSFETPEWCGDEYSEDVPTTITWVKSDGSSEVLRKAGNPINIQRRKNKILKIQFGDQGKTSMVISKDEQSLEDDVEMM